VGPEVSVVIGASPLSGVGERLAWVASRQHIDRFYSVPVDGGQVVQVGDAGEPLGEDSGRVLVVLAHPGGVPSGEPFGGKVEAAVPGA